LSFLVALDEYPIDHREQASEVLCPPRGEASNQVTDEQGDTDVLARGRVNSSGFKGAIEGRNDRS
jgi:hypothetical protein